MRTLSLIFVGWFAAIGLWSAVYAQENGTMDETLRVIPRSDGGVYVFHTKRLSAGHGFHVSRTRNGTTTQLTEAPVRGAQSATALSDSVSWTLMQDLQNRLDVTSPLEVYYELRADRTTALRFAFTSPVLARALGYLYVDKNPPETGEVTYRVQFVDVNGDPTGGEMSKTVDLPGDRPDAPTDLAVDHDGQELTLTWEYPTTTIGIPDNVVSFRAYRQTSSDRERLAPGDIVLRRVAKNEQHMTVPVPEAGTYTFVVTAVDITGQESSPSTPVEYTVEDETPPGSPKGVRSQVTGTGEGTITWSISPEPDVRGYHIYRAPRMVEEGTRLTDRPLPLDSTTFVDSTLVGGGKFVYRVTAVDSAGNESTTSQGTQIFINDRTPPSSPTDIAARFDSTTGHVRLSWQHTPDVDDFSDYAVLRTRMDGDALFTRLDSAKISRPSFVDQGVARQGLAEGARYRYGVAAVDSAGNHSDTVFVAMKVPNLTAPARPTQVSAGSPDGLDVDLAWTSPPDLDVTSYRIYRSAAGATQEAEGVPDSALAQVAVPRTSFEDTTAAVAQPYTYRVTAVDSLGKEGAPSDPVSFTLRDDAPPRPVRNVQARRRSTSDTDTTGVRITWGSVAAEDLDGYRIYRAPIPTGIYEPIQRVGSNTTSWTDPEGTTGMWYRVRAVDTSGNESTRGEPAEAVARPSTASP